MLRFNILYVSNCHLYVPRCFDWYVILCVECSTMVQPVQKLAEKQDYLRTQLFMGVL